MHDELIRSISNKVTLTSNEIEALKHFFIPKKIRKRHFVLNAGDVCQYQFFVEKGLLRAFSMDDKAVEHVVQFAPEGWWVSDICSFLSGDDALYSIEALEDSELLLLTKDRMDKMLEDIPKMERYFRLLMQNSIVALQRRITSVQSDSAEQKYLKLIETYPNIIKRSPQQHVASYLGITPETLSRIRKKVSTSH
jgi:CRP-like cAMP-binding protein